MIIEAMLVFGIATLSLSSVDWRERSKKWKEFEEETNKFRCT